MSNKIKGLIVTFKESISNEDAENYIRAIELLKEVVSLEISVDNPVTLWFRQGITLASSDGLIAIIITQEFIEELHLLMTDK